jgi:LPS export ABC transporter permease LptF
VIKTVDRYIIEELTAGTLTIVGIIGAIMVSTKIGEVVKITLYTKKLSLVLNLIILLIVSNLNLILPIAFLSSVTSLFLRLSADSEIVGMNSLGIPTRRLLNTTLLLATSLFLIFSFINMYIIPIANRSLEGLYVYATIKKQNLGIEPYKFTEITKDIIVYATEVSDSTLKNVVIMNKKDNNINTAIYAKEGKISVTEEGNLKFKLTKGNMLINNKNSISNVDFSNYDIEISANIAAKFRETTRKESTVDQLIERLRTEREIRKKNEILIHLYKRIALAFSPLVFSMVGIPLSIHFHRREKRWSLILTALIVLVYFGILSLSQRIMLKLNMPFMGAWLPNIILGIIGIILCYKKIDRSYMQ